MKSAALSARRLRLSRCWGALGLLAWAAAGLVPGLAIALTLAGALLLRPVWSFRLPSSVGRLGGTPPPAASVVSVVRA